MSFETLSFAVDEGVAHVTLDRPDNANAMNPVMARELLEVFVACDVDRYVRAVLLDAKGRIFCAGGDLAAFAAAGDDLARTMKLMTADLHAAIGRLARLRAPVVAAVQGAAAGAGLSLACACDLVIAADAAKLTMAYTRAGLVPDGSSTYFLPRLVGRRRALEMMLLNPVLSAEEARELGLVTRVVAADELGAAAQELVRELAAGPTGAFAAAKRLVHTSSNETLESQMELEAAAITDAAS
ncbi:MAG: enoyl-CoA hydratase-related protein, partial [Thermoanaerobaculia bacterium]|nr:enoyl-CoA hydratase-related protein [Thermoanaerobaculia bacterium]